METLFIGKNTIFLSATESTNSYATHLLKNVNLAEGTVIHAEAQSAGRGQRGSVWQTSPGSSLCASLVLRPTFLPIDRQYYLYKVSALAVALALSDLLDDDNDVAIKWPNDVLVEGKKVSGILIENQISGSQITSSIVGVGINLNQDEMPDLPRATSLKMISGRGFQSALVLKILCSRLEQCYLALKNDRTAWIDAEYRKRLFGLKDKREFIINSERQVLTVKGVSKKGYLSLEDENGRKIEADVKELEWVF